MSRRRGEAPEGWPVLLAPWQYRDHDPAKDHQPKTDRHITRWQRMASEWIEEHIHDRRARSTARAIVIEAPTFLNDGESLANGEPALSFTIRQMAERIGKSTDATAARLQKMCEPGGPLAIVWQGRAKWPTVYALAMASPTDQRTAPVRQEDSTAATAGPSAAPRKAVATGSGTTPHALAMAPQADQGAAIAWPEGAATVPPQRPRRATAAAMAGPSAAPRGAATGSGTKPHALATAPQTGRDGTATRQHAAAQAGPLAFDPDARLDTLARGMAQNQAWAEFCESARTMATTESQRVYAAGVAMGFSRDAPPMAVLTDRGAA